MFDRLKDYWFQLINKPNKSTHHKPWIYKSAGRRSGGLAKHVNAGTGTRPIVIPASYSKTRRRNVKNKGLGSLTTSQSVAPIGSSHIVHGKSSAKLIQDDEEESSDDDFTHVPVEHLRAYDMKKTTEEGAAGAGMVYIDMPPDGLEVVCDPVERKIHNWVERSFRILYYYWLLLICLAVLMITLLMYMFYILNELHAKQLLTDLFWKSRYVNVAGVTAVEMIAGGVGLVFLCFPNPKDWGELQSIRWILIVIPNVVMVIGLIDQIFWMFSYDKIVRQLEILLWRSLDEAALDPTYPANANASIYKSQNYLQCCGVRSYNDWEKATKFKTWGFPFSCCDDSFVDSCHVPITVKVTSSFDNTQINQIWNSGCYEEELLVFQITAGITWGVYIISTTTCVAFTFYMWNVIRHRNLHNVDVFHPF